MKYYQIVFSPTGGTERVARAITQNWSQIETIDLCTPDTNYSDISFDKNSLVLIAMPSFGGVAPQLALDRLTMFKGNGAKCAVVAVYGNRAYEDTLAQMEDYAQNTGFQVIAAISAVAEHSIIHEYAAGRPNEGDCKELAGFGDQILEKPLAAYYPNLLFQVIGHTKSPEVEWFQKLIPAVPHVVCAHRNVPQVLSLQALPE